MIKSSINNLFFIILISLYLIGQPACIEEYFLKKISIKMTLVQGRARSRRERFLITPLDSTLPLSQNFLISPLLLLSPSKPKRTYSIFLRLFWGLKLLLLPKSLRINL